MDFDFAKEQQMFRDAIRSFAEKEIAPLVSEAEEKEKFPVELFSKMGRLGYLGVRYPVEYGGGGMGEIGNCIALEEIARISFGISVGIGNTVGSARVIYTHGNEAQKQEYLVPVIKGEKIAAFGLSEPNAGSDAAAIQSTAVREQDKYILNGNKIFITNGTICDFVITAAYTDKTKGPRGGVSLFIVNKDTPGFSRRKLYKFCARSSETAELTFENCPVPEENLIGEEGRGFPYLMEILGGARISHSARSLGLAQAAYESSLQYAQERVQFGQPIAKFQAIAFKLARIAMEIQAARWLTYNAAWLFDQGRECLKEAVMAKLFASEVSQRVTSEAMQIYGGYALMEESPIQRYFRDARFNTITDGTSEIQQIIIARRIGIRL